MELNPPSPPFLSLSLSRMFFSPLLLLHLSRSLSSFQPHSLDLFYASKPSLDYRDQTLVTREKLVAFGDPDRQTIFLTNSRQDAEYDQLHQHIHMYVYHVFVYLGMHVTIRMFFDLADLNTE